MTAGGKWEAASSDSCNEPNLVGSGRQQAIVEDKVLLRMPLSSYPLPEQRGALTTMMINPFVCINARAETTTMTTAAWHKQW
jgi:hypothetical protein